MASTDRMKWLIVLFGIVVVGLVGLTGMDKYDEASCRRDPQRISPAVWKATLEYMYQEVRPAVYETCNGFLPW